MLFEPTSVAPFSIRLEADYPERLSRLSTLFRIVLAVPLLIFVALVTGGGFWTDLRDQQVVERGAQVSVGALGSLLAAYWIAVFLRRRPVRWLFDVIVAIQRFALRAASYFLLLTDRYPPFEGDWQVRFEVERPEALSRWRLVIWKSITVIPHAIVLAFLFVAVVVVVVIAWFGVLFTGRYPEGLHGFVTGWLRWSARAWSYWASLTDEFPSFSLSADAGPASQNSYVISAVLGVLVGLAWIAGISTFVAWPGETKETTVFYQALLQGEPSDAVEVSGVEVTLLAAGEAPDEEGVLFRPNDGQRLIVFQLELDNGSDFDAQVEKNDFRLADAEGDSHKPLLVTVDGRVAPRRIKDGRQGTVWVLFEADEDAQPAELKYEPSYGFKQRVKFTLE